MKRTFSCRATDGRSIVLPVNAEARLDGATVVHRSRLMLVVRSLVSCSAYCLSAALSEAGTNGRTASDSGGGTSADPRAGLRSVGISQAATATPASVDATPTPHQPRRDFAGDRNERSTPTAGAAAPPRRT